MLALLGVAILLFASTNIDDIFVLVGFFSDARFRFSEIVIGQYLGIVALVGISVAAAVFSMLFPLRYLGLMAVVPIVLGAKRLFEVARAHARDDADNATQTRGRGHGRVATVALVTVVNGGDNIGIYTPAFAVHSRVEVAVMVSVFLIMTAGWCMLASWIVNHRRIGAPIRRYGRVAAPVVLIALGIAIMFQAGTLGSLWRHTQNIWRLL